MKKDYNTHLSKCYKFGKEGTLLKLPEEGATMKFKNYKNQLERPSIVYADMESTLVKTDHKIISMSTFQILVAFSLFAHMMILKMCYGKM